MNSTLTSSNEWNTCTSYSKYYYCCNILKRNKKNNDIKMHLKIKFMITLELNKVVFKKTGLKLVICRSWVHGSFDLLVNNWVTLLHNKIVNDKNIKIDLYTGISFILIENTSQLFCQNIQNLVLREMLNNKNKCKCTFVHLGFGGLERWCFQSNLILCIKVEKEHDFPSSKTWHPPQFLLY